jgi:hypothetical protein
MSEHIPDPDSDAYWKQVGDMGALILSDVEPEITGNRLRGCTSRAELWEEVTGFEFAVLQGAQQHLLGKTSEPAYMLGLGARAVRQEAPVIKEFSFSPASRKALVGARMKDEGTRLVDAFAERVRLRKTQGRLQSYDYDLLYNTLYERFIQKMG